jgi:hypothetical protein
MSTGVHPLPPPPACLTRSYSSRGIKGGTVIAEDVLERSRHEKLLLDPDGYREVVVPCASCGGEHLHAHCFRTRSLRRAARGSPADVVTIRLYLCASCRAVFTVLPAFIARHLWRAWETVRSVVEGGARAAQTTARRWRARLGSEASQLLHLFMASVTGKAQTRLARLRPLTRGDFLGALFAATESSRFALVALWIHRLERGIRLM